MCYLRFGLEKTVVMLDQAEGTRLPLRDEGRRFDRHQRHGHPQREIQAGGRRRARGRQGAAAVSGRRDHQRRALQQGHRHLERRHGKSGGRNVQGARGAGQAGRDQPDLRHGRFRRARIEAADPAAFRNARIDGQALGRSHRDADHIELPRRPHRAAVLHLHARRPQGSGGYGAQDRRFRLSHAASRGRGAGRDHQRIRLRHGRRNLRRADSRSRRRSRAVARPR